MKNLKIITLLWFILISWTLSGCFRDKDSNNENPNNDVDATVQENDPVAIYYNNLIDIASKCLDSEQAISDTYNNPSSSTIDVKLAINKTLNQCLDASEEIQIQGDRQWDLSLNNWFVNVLDKTVNYYSKFSEYVSYEETNFIEDEDSTEESVVPTLTNISNELDILKEELDNATNELKGLQEEFANVHWLTLKN